MKWLSLRRTTSSLLTRSPTIARTKGNSFFRTTTSSYNIVNRRSYVPSVRVLASSLSTSSVPPLSSPSISAPFTTAATGAGDAAGKSGDAGFIVKDDVNLEGTDMSFDLVVIGSGPSGQKGAIAAAKLGKKVAVIDKADMLGGVCVHTGTIPSKTFREAVLYLTGYRQRGFYGRSHTERAQINVDDILQRVYKVEQWETEKVANQLRRNRITVFQGKAEFVNPHHIRIHQNTLGRNNESENLTNIVHAKNVLVACGTRPARNASYPFDGRLIFDSDQILHVSNEWDLPRHLIVVGSGVIGIEYASMFCSLPGIHVTIIDEKATMLPFVDSEIIDALIYTMRQNDATFRLGEKVKNVSVEKDPLNRHARGTVTVELESNKVVRGDALLYAVGRQGNVDSLNLGNAGLSANKRGLLSVNPNFQTSVPHVYAVGDVVGFPALASTAMEQGRIAARHMFDNSSAWKQDIFPYGIYTVPEISMVGKSEQDLTAEKIPYEVGIAKFEEIGKGQLLGIHFGFLKLLIEPTTKKLLGVHAFGENAAELVHIGQTVMTLGGTAEYFVDAVFNYPTFAEAYRVAALDGLQKGILKKK